ncbi:MAG: methyltransferase type 11, partial [Candidatus Methylomirabilales bacterium]
DLPYASGSLHLALASLLLHHLEGEAPVRLLRELDRVSSRAAVVNDLRRGWLPLAATWLGLRLCSRDPLIRHDGPLSVRRAFTPAELLRLAGQAGWRAPRVTPRVPFRLALVTRKGAGAG